MARGRCCKRRTKRTKGTARGVVKRREFYARAKGTPEQMRMTAAEIQRTVNYLEPMNHFLNDANQLANFLKDRLTHFQYIRDNFSQLSPQEVVNAGTLNDQEQAMVLDTYEELRALAREVSRNIRYEYSPTVARQFSYECVMKIFRRAIGGLKSLKGQNYGEMYPCPTEFLSQKQQILRQYKYAPGSAASKQLLTSQDYKNLPGTGSKAKSWKHSVSALEAMCCSQSRMRVHEYDGILPKTPSDRPTPLSQRGSATFIERNIAGTSSNYTQLGRAINRVPAVIVQPKVDNTAKYMGMIGKARATLASRQLAQLPPTRSVSDLLNPPQNDMMEIDTPSVNPNIPKYMGMIGKARQTIAEREAAQQLPPTQPFIPQTPQSQLTQNYVPETQPSQFSQQSHVSQSQFSTASSMPGLSVQDVMEEQPLQEQRLPRNHYKPPETVSIKTPKPVRMLEYPQKPVITPMSTLLLIHQSDMQNGYTRDEANRKFDMTREADRQKQVLFEQQKKQFEQEQREDRGPLQYTKTDVSKFQAKLKQAYENDLEYNGIQTAEQNRQEKINQHKRETLPKHLLEAPNAFQRLSDDGGKRWLETNRRIYARELAHQGVDFAQRQLQQRAIDYKNWRAMHDLPPMEEETLDEFADQYFENLFDQPIQQQIVEEPVVQQHVQQTPQQQTVKEIRDLWQAEFRKHRNTTKGKLIADRMYAKLLKTATEREAREKREAKERRRRINAGYGDGDNNSEPRTAAQNRQ